MHLTFIFIIGMCIIRILVVSICLNPPKNRGIAASLPLRCLSRGAPVDLRPKGCAAALEGTRLREQDVQRQLFLRARRSPKEGPG